MSTDAPAVLVYCAISKPKLDLATWHALRAGWAGYVNDTAPPRPLDEPPIRTGSLPNFVHPSALVTADARASFLVALSQTRATPALVRELPRLSRSHGARFADAFGTDAFRLTCYGYLSESGACLVLSVLELFEPSDLAHLDQQSIREFLQERYHTLPEDRASAEGRPATDLEDFVESIHGFRPDIEFRRGSTYLAAFIDRSAATAFDHTGVHRLEDGNAENLRDALKLRELDIDYAHTGWGNSTFVAANVPLALFLMPSIIAIDGAYAVTSFQLEQMMDKREGTASSSKATISRIERTISEFENYAFDAEMLEIEFENVRQQFKPWQRGVYDSLHGYWRLPSAGQTLQRALRHRLERERSRLTLLMARMERRRNVLLAIIALLELLAVTASFAAWFDLLDRAKPAASAAFYSSGPFIALLVALPFGFLVALVVFWSVLSPKSPSRG